MESLGLQSLTEVVKDRPATPDACPCRHESCRHLATFRGCQFDYLYATPELASRCRRLWLPTDLPADLSDHAPILADFDLSEPLGRTEWDPPTFARLITERNGPVAGRTLDELRAWAERKQSDLHQAGYRDARLDRLPLSTRIEPEMWFQLDWRGEKGRQYTCSVRSDGQIYMQFRYLQDPFAGQEARREVWERLKAIPGLNLKRQLSGMPAFPIAALDDRERLQLFIGVLDHIIDETVHALASGQGMKAAE